MEANLNASQYSQMPLNNFEVNLNKLKEFLDNLCSYSRPAKCNFEILIQKENNNILISSNNHKLITSQNQIQFQDSNIQSSTNPQFIKTSNRQNLSPSLKCNFNSNFDKIEKTNFSNRISPENKQTLSNNNVSFTNQGNKVDHISNLTNNKENHKTINITPQIL